MKYMKIGMLGAAVIALLVVVSSASATILTGAGGTTLGTGTSLSGSAEGTVTVHPPIGDIECKKSTVAGKTTNAGGTGIAVTGNIETLTFSECNASVTVLAKGTGSIEGIGSNNGTTRGSGTEVTVEFAGFHCIFRLNTTTIGTLTGSATTGSNDTLDIAATIPRTGGRSGAFCGSTAQMTGSYKGSGTVNVDK